MAEKLSINIDLSKSNYIHKKSHTEAVVHNNNSKNSLVEFTYRYDRIMFAGFVIVTIFIMAYVSFKFYSDSSPVSTTTQSKGEQSTVKQIIKEKHLLAAPQTTQQRLQHPVFLFYETINVLDTFSIDPVAHHIASTEPKKLSEVADAAEIKSEIADTAEIKPEIAAAAQIKPEIPDMAQIEPEMPDMVKIKPEIVAAVQVKPEIAAAAQIKPEIAAAAEIKPEIADAARYKPDEQEQLIQVPGIQSEQFIQIFSKNLSRVLLVKNIYKKEPVNELSYFVTGPTSRAEKVYLFTQLDNSIGQEIEHQWWYQGKIRHQKKFAALGKRWRCYSSKNLSRFQQGEWQVKVVDPQGNSLSEVNFYYRVN